MSVTLHTTKGDIKIELHCHQVPRSAANFLALCASDIYTKTPFHRIAPNFIVQTGDPTGSGKVSRAAFAKRLPDEVVTDLKFDKPGVVAFANAGRPSRKGVGSQFFITLNAAPHLDQTCTIVGDVIHGMSVVRLVSEVECDDNLRPKKDVFVESVTVHANPFADGSMQFSID